MQPTNPLYPMSYPDNWIKFSRGQRGIHPLYDFGNDEELPRNWKYDPGQHGSFRIQSLQAGEALDRNLCTLSARPSGPPSGQIGPENVGNLFQMACVVASVSVHLTKGSAARWPAQDLAATCLQ